MIRNAILTALHWDGDGPMPGQYLRSPRSAYLIIEVRRSRPGSKSFGRLVVERLRPHQIPKGAVVHRWEWAKR